MIGNNIIVLNYFNIKFSGTHPYVGYLLGTCQMPDDYEYDGINLECRGALKLVLATNEVFATCSDIPNIALASLAQRDPIGTARFNGKNDNVIKNSCHTSVCSKSYLIFTIHVYMINSNRNSLSYCIILFL